METTRDLEALVSVDDGATWRKSIIVPGGTVVTGIEFENPDPSVGIMSGTAAGTVTITDGHRVLVDFGGTHWDWWGEPVTEPGGEPVPGWFVKVPS